MSNGADVSLLKFPGARAREPSSVTIDAYTNHLKAAGRAPNTVHVRQYWARRVVAETDSTTEGIEAWLARHDYWKPTTVSLVVDSVTKFYGWAHDSGRMAHDPTAAFEIPHPRDPVPRRVGDAQLAGLLASLDGVEYWAVRLLADTGLRRAEAAALHSNDLDGRWLTVRGKGDRVRRVPVPDDLAAWIAGRRGPVFPSRRGEHLRPDSFGRLIRRATGCNPHAFRHSYATRVYRATHDLRALQELLGHASIATTQRYVATTDDELVAAAATVWAA